MKKNYREFCQQESLPIFMQDWWLEALCGDAWQPILIFDKEEKIEAAAIYHYKKKYGQTFILPLPLSPLSGIWFRYPTQAQKRHSRYHFEMKLTDAIIEKLPPTLLTITQLGIHFDNWLPFMWRGYRQHTRYTYLIEDLSNIKAIFQNFSTNVKRNIKKGADLNVEISDDTSVLYQLAQNSLARTGSKLNFSLNTLNVLYSAIKKNQSGQIFQVKNLDNQVLASVLIVWDREKAYFLLSGDDKKHPSASTVLIWEILQKMSVKGIPTFDFEGSMLEPVENFYRSFGATRQAYHLIFRAKNKFWAGIFTFLKLI